jgi:hypothetical protein
MPTPQVPIASGPRAPVPATMLDRQIAAERKMVRAVLIGILAAWPFSVAVTIGFLGLAIADRTSWGVWVGLGAGLGTYAAGFFGTMAGVLLSSHLFDEIDEDLGHER